MSYKEFDVNGIGKIKIYKRKNNRSLRLSVTTDNAIQLSMPLWTPYRIGLAFIQSKRDWISKQSYLRSEAIIFHGAKIGKSHHLIFNKVNNNITVKAIIHQNNIIVSYGLSNQFNDNMVQLAARNACYRALRQQANSLLSIRLKQLSNKHNLSFKILKIKRLKSRWGSCDQQNNIVLNLFLIQLPWEIIDYVILHELTHTKILHHGADFWNELIKIEPNARKLRKEIKKYHPTLMVA